MPDKISYGVVALLAATAGFIDAVGYISLGRIYTANMSGNSIAVGIQAAFSHWPESLRRFWPIFAFVVGMLFCRILLEIGARIKLRHVISFALLCEIMLLTPVFLTAWPKVDPALLYVALLALAMGIQNAAITNVQSVTIHTGFVTGILLKAVLEFTDFLSWLYDSIRSEGRPVVGVFMQSSKQKSFQLTVWLTFIWCSYVSGACFGTWGEEALRFKALAAPLIGLVLVIVVDFHHPLGTQEEKTQTNSST